MNKLLSALIVGIFATASMSAFAGAHGGAMKDSKAMDEKVEHCKKMDPKSADDKMKAECKKLSEGHKMDKMEKSDKK